jgi:hypothetical protein
VKLPLLVLVRLSPPLFCRTTLPESPLIVPPSVISGMGVCVLVGVVVGVGVDVAVRVGVDVGVAVTVGVDGEVHRILMSPAEFLLTTRLHARALITAL